MPIWLSGLIVAGLLALVGWIGYGLGWGARDADYQRHLTDDAVAAAQASEDARKAEQAHRDAIAAVEAKYQQELTDAQATADRVLADLRAGNLRLRREWQGCQARVPEAANTASQPDDSAELRATGASDLVRLARECDARVEGLQEVIRSWTR